jgi:hypothetical protein
MAGKARLATFPRRLARLAEQAVHWVVAEGWVEM